MIKQYDLIYVCLADGDLFPAMVGGSRVEHYMFEQDDVTVIVEDDGTIHFNWGDDNTAYITKEQIKRASSVRFIYSIAQNDKYYGQF